MAASLLSGCISGEYSFTRVFRRFAWAENNVGLELGRGLRGLVHVWAGLWPGRSSGLGWPQMLTKKGNFAKVRNKHEMDAKF